MRPGRLVPIVIVASLALAGCGSTGERPLTVRQVLTALHAHGVQARADYPPTGPRGSIQTLLNLFAGSTHHLVARIDGPNLGGNVTQSAGDLSRGFRSDPDSVPLVASSNSKRIIGRGFRVDNVVIYVFSMKAVPAVAAAVRDLRREAAS